MTKPVTYQIDHLDQIGATPVEHLARQIEAQLMADGLMLETSVYWNDRAVSISVDGQVVAFIAWRRIESRKACWISLGGTREGFRQQGLYHRAFAALIERLREFHPEIRAIDSGHHIDNHASRAMHLATGRKPDGITYTYSLERKPA